MAKSEIPSIVVQTGGCPMEGGRGTNGSSPPPAPPPCGPPPRGGIQPPVRLSKQCEVEVADEQAPVTIRLEVGTAEEEAQPGDAPSRASAQRLKVLVRSHALRDDASPPLDLSPEAATASPQMLSVQGPVSGKTSGNKPARLSKQGTSSSQGSLEGSSPSLSRDSSTETYTDSTGVDLEQFIVDTLHKNHKDRVMMLKIEQDLLSLVRDNKRQSFKFAQMSSYHRMLVHRVAAYFGLDHNVDQAGTAVIVSKTRNTRLPDIRFKDQIRDDLLSEEPKKLILKRDSASFEDGKESPERQLSLDSRRSKSIEEREEEYEKARARIFNQDEGVGDSPASRSSQEELQWSGDNRPWSSTDSDSSERRRHLGARLLLAPKAAEGATQGEPLAGGKFYSVLTKGGPGGPAVTKASSFGGVSLLHRDSSLTEARNAALRAVKADSFNVSSLPTVVQAPPPVATPPVEVQPLSSSAAPESGPAVMAQGAEEAGPVAAPPPPPPPSAPHQPAAAPVPRPQLYVAQLPWGAGPREAGALSLPPVWPLAGPSMLEAAPLAPTGLLLNPQAVAGMPLMSPEMAGGLVQGVRPRGGPAPLGSGGLLLSPLGPPPRGPAPTHPHHHHHQPHHHQQQQPQQLVYLPCVQPSAGLEHRKPGLLDTQEPSCEAMAGQLGSLTLVGGEPAEGPGGAPHPQGGFLVQAPLHPGFLALPGHPPPPQHQQQQQQPHQTQQQQQHQHAPTVSVQGPIYYVQPAPMTTCGRNYISSVPEAHANPQVGLAAAAAAGHQAGALVAGSPAGGGSYPIWGYYAPPLAATGLSNGVAEAGPPPAAAFLGAFAAPFAAAGGQGEPYHHHHHHHATSPPQAAPHPQHQQLVPMYLVATSPPAMPPQQPPPPASLPLRYLRPQTPPASTPQAQQQPLVGYALCSAAPPVVAPQHPLPPVVTAFQSLVPCVAARPAVATNTGAGRASLVGPASFAVGLQACGMAKGAAPFLGTHHTGTAPFGDSSGAERAMVSGGDLQSVGSLGASGGEDGQQQQHHHQQQHQHQQQRHRGGGGRNGSRTPAAMNQPPSTVAAMAALYRHSRGLSLLPDVRLLGHPLQQHHEGPPPAMLRGALRLVSQPPPAPATLGARPPRSARRQPRATPRAPSNPPSTAAAATPPLSAAPSTTAAAAAAPATAATGAGQVLEVLGLAEGLAPSEVEQLLEPLLRLGAQLKRAGPQLLACFDSPAAAQGALLTAGLPFQLRPLPPATTIATSSELLLPSPALSSSS